MELGNSILSLGSNILKFLVHVSFAVRCSPFIYLGLVTTATKQYNKLRVIKQYEIALEFDSLCIPFRVSSLGYIRPIILRANWETGQGWRRRRRRRRHPFRVVDCRLLTTATTGPVSLTAYIRQQLRDSSSSIVLVEVYSYI